MSISKSTKNVSLISAIAALGASVGAISTAYSEPARLSNSHMDAITAGGNEICPDCVSSPAPAVDLDTRDSGVLLIQWDLAAYPNASAEYIKFTLTDVIITSVSTVGRESISVKIPGHFIKEVIAEH